MEALHGADQLLSGSQRLGSKLISARLNNIVDVSSVGQTAEKQIH